MLPQTLSYCWQFRGENGARDRNGNARPISTDRLWKLDYTWLPPAPVLGNLGGTVRLNGSPLQGVTVTAAGQSQNTDANGLYLFTNVSPGTYQVSLSNLPVGVQCLSQTASVTAGQTTTLNINCTQTNFTLTLGLSYRHNGPGDSNTCVAISGALAAAAGSDPVALENIAGATYTVQWSGTGVVGTTQRSGTLNASSQALDRQPINLFGTYTANVSVTYQGVTKQASGTVTVSGMQGTCPQP